MIAQSKYMVFVFYIFVLTCFSFQTSDEELPVCSPNSVCNKIDTYATPYVDKLCRCPGSSASSSSGRRSTTCSTSTHARDGHTISDRTKQFKVRANKMERENMVIRYKRLELFSQPCFRMSRVFPLLIHFYPSFPLL